MSLSVQFDTQHLYYLPQYLPVAHALKKQGAKCEFIFYKEGQLDRIKDEAIAKSGFSALYLDSPLQSLSFYQQSTADWVIFGNKPAFAVSEKPTISAQLALMQHGIGPKACYYDVSEFPFDVRFVEGSERLSRLQQRFPDLNFVDTGYAKLDPLFKSDSTNTVSIEDLGLDVSKKTLLFAPTFFPSSIEYLSEHWPEQLSDYNIIVKPHFFSHTKQKYQAHRSLFSSWQKYSNVYVTSVDEYNLLPFMQIADIMLSDASSAIFEFAALNKPVVWCDFYHTRWSYKGLLSFRLKRRLDPDISLFHKLTTRAASANKIRSALNLSQQSTKARQAAREKMLNDMVGRTDGKCGERIVDFLLSHSLSGDRLA